MAINAGINTKINMVVMKGINDHEIIDFIHMADKYGVEVRFIEAMPFNQFDGNKSLFLPASDILALIQNNFSDVSRIIADDNSSSIKYLIEGKTKIGIIPAYSRSLCGSCNRIRLTPKGELLTCLYAEKGIELLPLVRNNAITDEQLQEIIIKAVWKKKENGFVEENDRTESVFQSMTTIGG